MDPITPCKAFTLIELLVVIAIISVLVGMFMVLGPLVGKQGKKNATRSILATLQTGIEHFTTEKGGAGLRGAPHPLLVQDGNRGVTLADRRSPLFYGSAARVAALPAAPQSAVTSQLNPAQKQAFNVVEAGSAPDRNRTYLQYVLGHSTAESELRRLKAVVETSEAGNLLGGALYSPDGSGVADGQADWEAGRISIGQPHARDGGWKTYRLPGMAIVDAWGREVLLANAAQGRFALMSAGADGVIAIHPGTDLEYQTTVDPTSTTAPSLAGDDEDGGRDNLVLGHLDDR